MQSQCLGSRTYSREGVQSLGRGEVGYVLLDGHDYLSVLSYYSKFADCQKVRLHQESSRSYRGEPIHFSRHCDQ